MKGGVEQLVDFGKLVEFGGVADLPFHLPDDGSEGFHVRLGPERQGFGDARPFEDTRDDVAVVDFLSGHLPDVFALLRLRSDQPLNEHLQLPVRGSADRSCSERTASLTRRRFPACALRISERI